HREGGFGDAGGAEEFDDQGGLGAHVGVDVVRVAGGELELEGAVALGGGGVRAQVVAQREVIPQGEAVFAHDVEVVGRRTFGPGEGFAPFDAEVTAVYVPEASEPLDCLGDERGVPGHHDVDIDDRLRGEAGYRRAAHVFDADGHAFQR